MTGRCMELIQTIPADVARKLGYYVYVYVNPLDGQIFYVGKGKGRRVLSHLEDRSETRKLAAIKQIRAAGRQPRLEFLTNQVRGWRSSRYGRTPLGELIALYRRQPVRIQEPSILIRITELYRPQMTASELYDATRASWKLGQKRQLARYAFAVFEGVVREVYEITQWFQAGSTFNSRDPHGVRSPDRWEFVGRLAPEGVRRRYINRDVSSYFKRGNQNPISYVKIR